MIWVKRLSKPFFSSIFQPIKTIGNILLKTIGIPVYRGVFFVRRLVDQVLLPAKHKFFYLLSNRYTIHVLMIILVGIIGFVNVKTQNVRAETFGQKSILYSIVSPDDSGTVEVVEAGKSVLVQGGASSYFAETFLDQRTQIYQDELDSSIATTSSSSSHAVPTRTRTEKYTVQDGDTLGRISVKFNLSISTILSANGLSLRSTIRPGDILKILPVDGVMYTVRSGDTLSKIANKYHIDAQEIAGVNQLAKNGSLQIGTEILLPGASEIASAPTAIAKKPVSVKDIISNTNTKTTSISKAGWIWPTNMHVITQYYSWKHTGIDIDADYSTFSLAARDGVVTYTGWRSGYGLTVEMDHGNGYKTRYAHNSKILVSVGDVLTAGTRLAKSGSTGNSTGTHLHFEILLNGKFQNPLSYIR